MKKISYALFALIALPAIMFARPQANDAVNTDQAIEAFNYFYAGEEINADLTPGIKNEFGQEAIELTRVFELLYTWYFRTTPLVYDPVNGMTMLIVNNRPDGTGTLDLFYTPDLGGTWGSKNLYSSEDPWYMFPSMGFKAPEGSTNINDYSFLGIATRFEEDPGNEGYYQATGKDYLVYQAGEAPETFENFSPETGLDWSNPMMYSRTSGGAGHVVSAAQLWPEEGSFKAPAIGYSHFVFEPGGDFNLNYEIPATWDQSNFKQSTNQGSTYNGPLSLGSDDMGNFYCGMTHFLKPDEDNRLPMYSKLEIDPEDPDDPFSYQWSVFEPCPKTVIDQYILDQSGLLENSGMMSPYQQDAFAVTGEDEIHYIYRLWIVLNDEEFEIHFVEVYRKNGVWSTRKIAEYYPSMLGTPWANSNGNQIVHVEPITFVNVADAGQPTKDSIAANARGAEVQAAVTADRSKIVVKYLSHRPDNVEFTNPFAIYGGQVNIEALPVTDIFMTYIDLDEPNPQWNEPVNLTDDENHYMGTMIPEIVPDIDHVPFIFTQFEGFARTTEPVRETYPTQARQMLYDQFNIRSIRADFVSARGVVGVEEEQETSQAILNDVYPNPVPGWAEITFNLDRAGDVLLQVHDATGAPVKTLVDTYLPAGFHGKSINMDEYAQGVYYYTLTIDGSEMLTKMMTVVR